MRKLKKSSTQKSIYGVCGGLAEFFGISALGIRLIFLVTLPVSLIIYVILVNSLDDSNASL